MRGRLILVPRRYEIFFRNKAKSRHQVKHLWLLRMVGG